MAAHLGHVLYWAFSGIALLLVGAAVYGAVDDFRRGIDLEGDAVQLGTNGGSNLAKVGVEGSNPFARSNFSLQSRTGITAG